MMFRFKRRARVAGEPVAPAAAVPIARVPSRPSVEPVWVDLSRPGALGQLGEAVARWSAGAVDGGRDTVMRACDLLVEGVDTPSLRDLAGLPLNAGWWESREVVVAACDELDLPFFLEDSVESRLIIMRYLCRGYLAGEINQSDFLARCSGLFFDEPPAVAVELSYLNYAFDQDERVLNPAESVALDELAERHARAFLAATA